MGRRSSETVSWQATLLGAVPSCRWEYRQALAPPPRGGLGGIAVRTVIQFWSMPPFFMGLCMPGTEEENKKQVHKTHPRERLRLKKSFMYLLSFVAINYVYMILNCWVSLAHMFALVKTCRKILFPGEKRFYQPGRKMLTPMLRDEHFRRLKSLI
jgi:hypothetical protein